MEAIENISSFDKWISKRVRENGSLCKTFRDMRKKLKWIGDVVIINYICRRYREEGVKASRYMLSRMFKESEEIGKMSPQEKGLVWRDALGRIGIV